MENNTVKTIGCGIVRDEQGRLLISRRKADQHLGGFWEFPGGKLKADETIEEAVRRELKEELNIDVSVGKCLHTKEFSYPDRTVRLSFYLCQWLEGQPENREVCEHRWVFSAELPSFPFPPANDDLIQLLVEDAFD